MLVVGAGSAVLQVCRATEESSDAKNPPGDGTDKAESSSSASLGLVGWRFWVSSFMREVMGGDSKISFISETASSGTSMTVSSCSWRSSPLMCWRREMLDGSSWIGASQTSPSSCCGMSGVAGQLDNTSSSEVMLPSNDGVDDELGMRRLLRCSCSRTEAETLIFVGGDSGVMADLSFSIVGHSLGDGIAIDGRLCFGAAIRFFTELESLIGTSPSDSLDVKSYISSNSLLELRLLHIELPSDCVSELAGDAGIVSAGT